MQSYRPMSKQQRNPIIGWDNHSWNDAKCWRNHALQVRDSQVHNWPGRDVWLSAELTTFA